MIESKRLSKHLHFYNLEGTQRSSANLARMLEVYSYSFSTSRLAFSVLFAPALPPKKSLKIKDFYKKQTGRTYLSTLSVVAQMQSKNLS